MNIYLVTCHSSCYDMTYQSVVKAFTSNKAAEVYIAQLEYEQQVWQRKAQRILADREIGHRCFDIRMELEDNDCWWEITEIELEAN